MKLEKSKSFTPPHTCWRVCGGRVWGPYSYSRRHAIWYWLLANLGFQFSYHNKPPKPTFIITHHEHF